MILLDGQSLKVKDRFRCESMGLNLEERNSSATITLGPEAPEIAVNNWLMDDTEPGKGIVWRVKGVRKQIETQTRTITLEHMIQALRDQIMFGEVTPKTIAGGNATKCTARQAINYALGKQAVALWKLGELCANPSNPYNFNGENIFAALETITGTLDGAQWEYDMTSLPFTLHIRKEPSGFQSEMRMSRNVTTLSINIDRGRMYTRHYPIGKNNLHIDGNYTSKNESVWGVVAKVETDQSLATKAELKAWSQERLNRHCEPQVTVTMTGLDLSADTGEPLDHIVVGRRCRMPLPEYGTVMTERVTKLSWSDKIREPDRFTATLANLPEDVASIINSQSSSSGKAGRVGAKQNADDHAWFEDTSTHVAMVAEAVAGPGAATNWSRVSQVIVDGMGIHQRVTRTEGDVVAMWASIDVLEDRIVLEVANAKSDTFSRIEQTASSIRSEVNSSKSSLFSAIMQTSTMIYLEVGNAKSDTYSKIEQTASSIRSTVNSAKSSLYSTIMQTSTMIYTEVGNAKSGLYSSIEQTASQISLKASKVYVDGELDGLKAKFNSITVVEGSATYLQSGKVYATTSMHVGSGTSGGSGTFYYRGTAYYPNYLVLKNSSNTNIVEGTVLGTQSANNSLDMTHYHEITIAEGTGTLAGKMVVTLGKPSSSEGSANFKIADTTAYKDGVKAAKNAVKVTGPTWTTTPASGISVSNNTAKFTTDADSPSSGTPKSLALYMNTSGWSNGSNTIYVTHTDSEDAHRIMRYNVSVTKNDISIPTSWSSSSDDPSADVKVSLTKTYTYHKCTITVHGRTKTLRVKLI